VTLRNNQNAKAGLPPLTPEEVDFIKKPIVDAARSEMNAYHSTSNIWDDGILDPAETRDVLGLAISASLNAPLRNDVYGYGIFRM
jgi:acetyl-CoA carboxylase carboxyltransferase component